jgi:phytoene/squalene synthetase
LTKEAAHDLDAEAALVAALDGRPTGPVFTALADTVERHSLDAEPLLELLAAFRRDARDETFVTWDDLLGYCRGSANTIGRLVLALHQVQDLDAIRRSDAICTALQLTNFWQDLGVDLARGRLFVPLEDLRRFGLDRDGIQRPEGRGNLTRLLVHECRATDELYERGRGSSCAGAVRPFLQLTITGGRPYWRGGAQGGGFRAAALAHSRRARILIPALLGFDV